MSSNVPWKELAVAGATTLGVCCVIGWLTGTENLEKKKKPQQRGPPGAPQQNPEHQEFDALLSIAEAGMQKGAYAEVERAYLRIIEITSNSEDPQLRIIPHYIHRRLTEMYEKMGNWEKCLKYFELIIDHLLAKEDPSQDDLQTLLVTAERSVDICMPHGTVAQQEKFLKIWLEIGTKFKVPETIVMASLLLGKIKFNQEKLVEAEAYLRRATSVYTDTNQREELWLNTKTAHLECLTRLEMHADAKKCIREIADFLLNNDLGKANSVEAKMLGSMVPELLYSTGERCVFLGYLDEADYILRSTLSLMRKKSTPVTTLAQVDHSLAVTWSQMGRLLEASEKINEMKQYLRASVGSSIFPMYSKFLQTQNVQHDSTGTKVTLHRGRERTLKPGSVLVIKFENPEGDVFAAMDHVVTAEDDTISFIAPIDYSTSVNDVFSAEVTVYNADRSEVIGTHFVFIPTATPESATPSQSTFSPSAINSTISDNISSTTTTTTTTTTSTLVVDDEIITSSTIPTTTSESTLSFEITNPSAGSAPPVVFMDDLLAGEVDAEAFRDKIVEELENETL